MSQDVYVENMANLFVAIKHCIENKLFIPGLILLYSGIDIFAWLDRPKNKVNVSRKDFINWVDKYLLPESGLSCSGMDLYSARCSLVHSYTFESNLTRKGEAKRIVYAWGIQQAENLQEIINLAGDSSTVAIHINRFYDAFFVAVGRFNEDLKDNKERLIFVYERANKFFMNMPPLKLKKE